MKTSLPTRTSVRTLSLGRRGFLSRASLATIGLSGFATVLLGSEQDPPATVTDATSGRKRTPWEYSAKWLRPFWLGDTVVGESVLLIRNDEDKPVRVSLLFPISEIIEVRNSDGDIAYGERRDYWFDKDSHELVIPVGSKIVTSPLSALRRPANSQRHRLTHRDGNGEIFFGGKLEYHRMQTSVTYKTSSKDWPVSMPSFNIDALPITLRKLRDREDVSMVLLGDSISTGCNASGWGDGAPYQPPYQDLLVQHLREQYQTSIELTNLSVGGTATPWGISKTDKVVESQPDLVILAFGMNDSAGREAREYGQNVAAMIERIRTQRPETEFILIASMLGNRDWTVLLQLNQES